MITWETVLHESGELWDTQYGCIWVDRAPAGHRQLHLRCRATGGHGSVDPRQQSAQDSNLSCPTGTLLNWQFARHFCILSSPG
eukprot:3828678-Amphidinium_carterae.1